MLLWVLQEETQVSGTMYMAEYARENCFPPCNKRVIGAYTSHALARVALSTRLRPLYGDGDCFTAPCQRPLRAWQRWADDGTGKVHISMFRGTWPDDKCIELELAISKIETDQQPPADQASSGNHQWRDLLEAVEPAEAQAPPSLQGLSLT